MSGRNAYFSVALSAVLVTAAWAGGKKIKGLNFQLVPQPGSCFSQQIHVWQEPDPFFDNLKQGKITLQYQRGHDVVANFPDSITIIMEFRQGLAGLSACEIQSDLAKLKFHLEWKDDSHTMPVTGNSLRIGKSSSQEWCEDKCASLWTYELRIDSQNVPLQDALLLRVESEDGTRLVEYVGKLSTDPPQMPPLPR